MLSDVTNSQTTAKQSRISKLKLLIHGTPTMGRFNPLTVTISNRQANRKLGYLHGRGT